MENECRYDIFALGFGARASNFNVQNNKLFWRVKVSEHTWFAYYCWEKVDSKVKSKHTFMARHQFLYNYRRFCKMACLKWSFVMKLENKLWPVKLDDLNSSSDLIITNRICVLFKWTKFWSSVESIYLFLRFTIKYNWIYVRIYTQLIK